MKPTEDQLRHALRAYAADITATHAAPPASLVWLRSYLQAQRRVRRAALARATLPLRLMQGIGVFCAILICAWCLHQSQQSTDATLSLALLRWAAPAILMVAAGSWVLVYASRKLFTT